MRLYSVSRTIGLAKLMETKVKVIVQKQNIYTNRRYS